MNASKSLPTGTPHATAAAKHVERLNRTAALAPSSRSRKLRSSQLASATRRANDSSLRSGCTSCESSLEIGAAVVAQQHEYALKHRRVSSRLDQRPLVDQCAVGQQELDDVAPVENRRRIAANFSSSRRSLFSSRLLNDLGNVSRQ
jgi:hypothetical protein